MPTLRATGALLFVTAFTASALAAQAQIELLSRAVTPPTTAGGSSTLDDRSRRRVISQDGRYVVFVSGAPNLVPGQIDGNDTRDVFLRDLTTGQILLVSHSSQSPTHAGNSQSKNPSISADGRFVAFESGSTNLVTGQAGGDASSNVFLFDRSTGGSILVSHEASNPNQAGAGSSGAPAINADGRFVAYLSTAVDLVAGQVDPAAPANDDVFLFDRLTGGSVLVSHAAGLAFQAASGSGSVLPPAISDDGRFVAFESRATNIVAGQTGFQGAVFVYDQSTGQSALASHTSGNPVDAVDGSLRALSGNGRYVFFTTTRDLTTDGSDFDSNLDHYRFDRETDAIILVSRSFGAYARSVDASFDGEWAVYGDGYVYLFDARTGQTTTVDHLPGSTLPSDFGYSEVRSISADGRYVAFSSSAPDLVPGQADPVANSVDAFLYDRDTGDNVLLSHPPGDALAAAGGLGEERPIISSDGTVVAFSSSAPTLVAGDTNHHADVFAYTRTTASLVALSLRTPNLPSASGNRTSDPAAGDLLSATARRFSADGQVVLLESAATNLVAGQLDDGLGAIPEAPPSGFVYTMPGDVYSRDRAAGITTLVSHALGAFARRANRPSTEAVVSADGRFVAYVSKATDLVAAVVAPGSRNVYLFDRATGQNTLVSRSAINTAAGASGDSFGPSISSDGRFVAFLSTGTDVVPGQVDGNTSAFRKEDVFLYDRLTTAVTLVSHRWDSATISGNEGAASPVTLSLDGRYVAFATGATNLIPNQTGPTHDNVFLFDRITNSNRLVSHAVGAPSQGAAGSSARPELSADGRYMAYRSGAADITVHPSVSSSFVFRFECLSGVNTLVSDGDFKDSLRDHRPVTINADGRFVAYESRGREVPGQTFTTGVSIFLLDTMSGERVLVSHGPSSELESGSGHSALRGISADGRFVLFASIAGNLDPSMVGSGTSFHLFDRLTGSNLFISRHSGPSDAIWGPFPSLSADGLRVAFGHTSSQLVANDFNGFGDAFVYNVTPGADVAVSKTGPASAGPGQDVSFTIGITNVGTMPAEGVVLSDQTPPGLALGPVTGACASFPCSLGTLAVGDRRDVDVIYSIPQGYSSPAPIVNVATVSTTSPDPDLANNTAFAQVTLPSAFHTVPPCRLVDTRLPNGPFGGPALSAGGERVFTAPGACGIPTGANSLALNVTVVTPSHGGFVRLAPVGAIVPQTSSINFGPDQTRANNAVVAIGVGGQIAAALGAAAGQAHLILDVVGYFK